MKYECATLSMFWATFAMNDNSNKKYDFAAWATGMFASFMTAATATAQSDNKSTIPSVVRQIWREPVKAFERQKSKSSPLTFEVLPFELTSQHLSLLRQAVFVWDIAGFGGPKLDPARPYGRRDLLPQLGEAFSERAARIQARRHVEMMFALGALLQHGELSAGNYSPRNVSSAKLREHMTEPDGSLVPLSPLALSENGSFIFKVDHRQLLKFMTVQWVDRSTADERLSIDEYPGFRFDPKRLYGDRANYVIDIALILKRSDVLQKKVDDKWLVSSLVELEFQNLHRQMLFALQVFVENATIAAGSYSWVKPIEVR
jgi:hypothetical protein